MIQCNLNAISPFKMVNCIKILLKYCGKEMHVSSERTVRNIAIEGTPCASFALPLKSTIQFLVGTIKRIFPENVDK